jgi:hypothetical protein
MDTYKNLGGDLFLSMIVLVNYAIQIRISQCSKSNNIIYFENGIQFSYSEWCKLQLIMHEWRTDQIGSLFRDQHWHIFVNEPGNLTLKAYNESINLSSSQFEVLVASDREINSWYKYFLESNNNYN